MGTGHWGTGSGRAGRAVVAAVVVLAGLGAATGAHAGTVLVDRGTDGAPGDNYADTSTMTRDGRYVAYTSQASNLTATPTAGRAEMYLLDRTTGISELVSVAADGTAANDNANFGAISDDGNVVAFSSPADNLDPTAQIHHTGRPVTFAKEPLPFSSIEPAVHSIFSEYVFFFGKRSFLRLDSKYAFIYLQFCHYFCLGHNYFFLTPI